MNRIITVLVVAIMACTASSTLTAQSDSSKSLMVKKLDKILNLTATQETQVANALTLARKGHTKGEFRTMESATARKDALRSIRTIFVAEVDKILTAEQKVKFNNIKSKLIPS